MTGRRWFFAAAVAWGLVLVVAAAWSAREDPATVREQSSLEQARHTVTAAVAALAHAAGPGVGVDIQPDPPVVDCRLTVARRGAEFDQVVMLTVPEGQEPALLEKLAQKLPPRWEARHHERSHRLVADAGDFVGVHGEVAEPGQVRVSFRTGCRP